MPSMLESFIPRPHVLERDRVAVVADVPKTWEAVRHLDGYRSTFVRALFALRHLPDLVTGHLGEVRAALTPHATIDDLAAPGSDFQLLEDAPQKGFVVGAVGRFWQPRLEFHHVAPHEFASFAAPGSGKIVWGLSVDKRRSGGSWVTFELRVETTDEASQAAFDRYWTLIGPFSHAIRTAVLSMVQKQLDAIDPANISLPGDLIVPAKYTRTMGVVVEAPPMQVWPWLAQLGCQRAGWYALDRLDNGGEPSANIIHPEWQDVKPGDLIAATPDGRSHFGVLVVDPGRALVIGSPSLRKQGPPTTEVEPDFKMTWAFVLEAIGEDACWLGARVRANYEPSLDFAVRHGWEALAHAALQRAQLQNIKGRAERWRLSPSRQERSRSSGTLGERS
jgi:hypothetical protein